MKFWLLCLIIGLYGMFMAACPAPPSPPPTYPTNGDLMTHAPDAIPACPATTTETPEEVCDSLFTADNHACVMCVGGQGCIDHAVEVYCARGPCALDANCHRVADSLMGKKRGDSK